MKIYSEDDTARLISELQDFLQDGVVLVVGSGLTISYGLPSMSQLAEQLRLVIPAQLHRADEDTWKEVEKKLLSGTGLENALQGINASLALLSTLVKETADFVESFEQPVIRALSEELRPPVFGKLAAHILRSSRTLHVVTSNYDRIIEVEAEVMQVGVDTGYVGTYVARHNCDRSQLAHKEYHQNGKSVRTTVKPHIRLHKPHGSLDWYSAPNGVIRSSHRLELPRSIITPGLTKYQHGYQQQYDQQRTAASTELMKASRVLVIGYGFNDDQLEQSWCPTLATEKKLILVTKSLTQNAERLLKASPNMLAITEAAGTDTAGSALHRGCNEPMFIARELWSITGLYKEIIDNA